jgi:hypothetical protein
MKSQYPKNRWVNRPPAKPKNAYEWRRLYALKLRQLEALSFEIVGKKRGGSNE